MMQIVTMPAEPMPPCPTCGTERDVLWMVVGDDGPPYWCSACGLTFYLC